MKIIVHVVSLQGLGGVQQNFLEFYNSLNGDEVKNHKVFIIGKNNKKYLKNNFYSLYSVKNLLLFLYYLRSKKYIIHFYNNFGSVKLYYLLKYFKNNNIIVHERGTSWNLKKKYSHRLQYVYSKVDKIIVNSYATKFLLINKFTFNEKINKFKVIYNGINSLKYKIQKNNINKKCVVGYLGRLETPKSVHTIIDLAKILNNKKEKLKYEFLIAGNGNLTNFLKKYANKVSNVKFLGLINNKEIFFNSINILIVPSIREPFGNIILEAGLHKVPVLATCIDGIPEIIDSMEDGILIEPKKTIFRDVFFLNQIPIPEYVYSPNLKKLVDPKELDPITVAQKLIEVSENKELIEKITSNLFKKVVTKFTMKKYCYELNQVYNQISHNEEK